MSETAQPLQVDCRLLLSIYLIVPITILVIALDQLVLDKYLLQSFLPIHPSHWPFWVVLFGLPHICSSLITFADKDYLKFYKRKLSIAVPLIIAASYLLHVLIGSPYDIIVLAALTMYHVLGQQLGLTRMMIGKAPKLTFGAWKWLLVAGAVPMHIMFHSYKDVSVLNWEDATILNFILGLILTVTILATYFAVKLSKGSQAKIGTIYLWANMLTVYTSFLALNLGYFAFTVIMPRIIHDLTAFAVYMTHDHNRNKGKPKSYFYRLTGFTRLPVMLLCPLIAIAIAYPITQTMYLSTPVYLVFVVLCYTHYYMEESIWKSGTPHRQHVSFAR